MSTNLILGTAGHIDHGKTALIEALTGVNTDRLPAEKERGITIDLGFAQLELGAYRLGIVDVPGHERFVRNMLAGATGVDMALLVVAADDSIMPQTREHLEILQLLHLNAGVIALTKCDLVDDDWLDLVEQEVRELVSDTFLADAPIIRTAATKGQGVDELRAALEDACRRARPKQESSLFRIAIDRSFAIQGYGTVCTGSVSSGRARVGDELEIQPGNKRVRIRGLQNHEQTVEEVHRGQRAAVNVGGVHHRDVFRGQQVATPGYLRASKIVSVALSVLADSPLAVKHRAEVRFHLGTAELIATVALLDADVLRPGESGLAQLFLREPAAAVWGQPFVIRSASPMVTIGGGQVLQPVAVPLRRRQRETLSKLASLKQAEPIERASAAIWFTETGDWSTLDLCRDAGLVPDEVDAVLDQLRQSGSLVELPVGRGRVVRLHAQRLEELLERVVRAMARLHARLPLQASIERQRLASEFAYLDDDAFVQSLVDRLLEKGELKGDDRRLALKSHAPRLSAAQQKLLEQIVEAYREGGFQPPDIKSLESRAGSRASSISDLVSLGAESGHLVRVTGELYLHEQWERELRERMEGALRGGEGLTVSQVRELLGTSRKYAVPFCEYLDRIGVTRREGDLRTLAG